LLLYKVNEFSKNEDDYMISICKSPKLIMAMVHTTHPFQ